MCDCKCNCKNYEKKEEKIKWEGIVIWKLQNGNVTPYGDAATGYGTYYFQDKFHDKLAGKITRMTIEEV